MVVIFQQDSIMNFLSMYRKYKDVFIKPKISLSFGLWKNHSGLPVWRSGNVIRLTSNHENYTEDWIVSKVENSHWTDEGKKAHPILSRLFKPCYQLPLWLSFYKFDFDINYTIKYDSSFRIDFFPSLTLVFFGLHLTLTAESPDVKDIDACDEDYWEALVAYDFFNGDLTRIDESLGTTISCIDTPVAVPNKHYVFNEKYLKKSELRAELSFLREKEGIEKNPFSKEGIYFNYTTKKVIRVRKKDNNIIDCTCIDLKNNEESLSCTYDIDDYNNFVEIISKKPYYKFIRYINMKKDTNKYMTEELKFLKDKLTKEVTKR